MLEYEQPSVFSRCPVRRLFAPTCAQRGGCDGEYYIFQHENTFEIYDLWGKERALKEAGHHVRALQTRQTVFAHCPLIEELYQKALQRVNDIQNLPGDHSSQ